MDDTTQPSRPGKAFSSRCLGKLIWHISYKTVRRVVVDYPTESPLFYRDGNGFGDWGHHELTDAGSGFLRHEILFSRGTVLMFEFTDVEVSYVERAKGPAQRT